MVDQIKSIIDLDSPTVLCLLHGLELQEVQKDPNLVRLWAQNNNIITNFSALCRELVPSQVLFLSSAGGIYSNNVVTSHSESSVPAPTSPYGEQKLEAEAEMSLLREEMNLPVCILRISCAYGFNSNVPDQGVLNKWLFDGLVKGEIGIYNSLDSRLNFISFRQLASSFLAAISFQIDGIYNLGASRSIALYEIYRLVAQLIPGVKSSVIGTSCRYLNIDNSKFELDTGLKLPSRLADDVNDIFRLVKEHVDCVK